MASPKATFTISAVDKTREAFRSFNQNIDRTRRGLTSFQVGAVGAFAAVGAAAIKATQSTARIGDVADRLGATTSGLQELQLAAAGVGIPLAQLETGLQRLTRRGADAIAGNVQLRQTFEEIGISLEEVSDSTPDQLFRIIAERIENVEGSGQQLLRFFRLFDVEGTDLIRVARQLADDGFGDLIERAKEAGAVLDESVIRQAQATRAEIAVVQRVVGQNLAQALLAAREPILALSRAFLAAAEAARIFYNITQRTAAARTASTVQALAEERDAVTALIEAYERGERAAEAALISEFDGDVEAARERVERLNEDIEALVARFAEIEELESRPLPDLGGRAIGGAVAGGEELTEEDKQRLVNGGLTDEELERGRQQTLLDNNIYSEASQAKIRFRKAEAEAAQRAADQELAANQLILGSASATLNALAGTSEKLKGLRIAAAVVDMYAGANRAFAEHPFPQSAAIAASIIASGIANIAAMRSGSGGGGGGGGLSATGAAAAEPAPAEQGPRGPTFQVQFNSSLGLYDESSLRRLFDALTEAAEDGNQSLSGRFVVDGI